MKARKDLSAYVKLPHQFDVADLNTEYLKLSEQIKSQADFISYDYSGFFDLTQVTQTKPLDDKSWVGVNKEALINQNGGEYLMNRLEYSKQKNPLLNDRNHNDLKPWAEKSLFVQIAESLGNYSRITVSWLNGSGWWPAHYDYDTNNAIKVHVPILTNAESFNCSWDPIKRELIKVHMAAGESWFLNPGFKHMAINWGKSLRVHLVISLKDQEVLKEPYNEIQL